MKEGKLFQISQNEVLNAYKAVKANKGAGGVNGIEFDIVGLFDNINHEKL